MPGNRVVIVGVFSIKKVSKSRVSLLLCDNSKLHNANDTFFQTFIRFVNLTNNFNTVNIYAVIVLVLLKIPPFV